MNDQTEQSFEKNHPGERDRGARFVCAHCGRETAREGAGSAHRNHCPNCLRSLHLDDRPGDRSARCGGVMDPVAVWVRNGGEWAVIHRCRRCGTLRSNRIAADDNPLVLVSLAVKPVASPPFPLERLREMAGIPQGGGGFS